MLLKLKDKVEWRLLPPVHVTSCELVRRVPSVRDVAPDYLVDVHLLCRPLFRSVARRAGCSRGLTDTRPAGLVATRIWRIGTAGTHNVLDLLLRRRRRDPRWH